MVTQHPQETPNSTDTTTSVAGRTRFRRTGVVGAVGASVVLAMSVLSACSDGDTSTDAGTTPIEGAGSTGDSAAEPTGTPADTPADSGDNARGNDNSGSEDRCTTDGLDIALGQSQGAAGSLLVDVNFTNSASEDCTLSGFPGIALVDDTGDPIGAPAVREDNAPGGVVDLRPGDSAIAALKISRAENYDEQTCGPTPANGLQVIVPEETDTTVLSFTDGAGDLTQVTGCTDDSVELLSVQPLAAGA